LSWSSGAGMLASDIDASFAWYVYVASSGERVTGLLAFRISNRVFCLSLFPQSSPSSVPVPLCAGAAPSVAALVLRRARSRALACGRPCRPPCACLWQAQRWPLSRPPSLYVAPPPRWPCPSRPRGWARATVSPRLGAPRYRAGLRPLAAAPLRLVGPALRATHGSGGSAVPRLSLAHPWRRRRRFGADA